MLVFIRDGLGRATAFRPTPTRQVATVQCVASMSHRNSAIRITSLSSKESVSTYRFRFILVTRPSTPVTFKNRQTFSIWAFLTLIPAHVLRDTFRYIVSGTTSQTRIIVT